MLPTIDGRARIVEPACSAGDICGAFATHHDVTGIDVVPGAVAAAKRRYPDLTVIESRVEDVEPIDCDILVMCEFLEHIWEPVEFVKAWMPRARYVIISHPLVGDGNDPEVGHAWTYKREDFENWFPLGGHRKIKSDDFDMGYKMVIGVGEAIR